MAREVKQWITVNGKHVPIFEGESTEEAIKRAVSGQKNTTDNKKKKTTIQGPEKTSETRTENQTRQDELKQQIKNLEKHAFNKDARVVLDELRAREDEHRRFEADKEDMDERLEELKKKEKQLTKTDAFNPQARSTLKDLRARIDEIQKIKRNDEHEIPTSKKVKSKEESIKEKQIARNKKEADERTASEKKAKNSKKDIDDEERAMDLVDSKDYIGDAGLVKGVRDNLKSSGYYLGSRMKVEDAEIQRWDGKSDYGYVKATYTLYGGEYGKEGQSFTEELRVPVRKSSTLRKNNNKSATSGKKTSKGHDSKKVNASSSKQGALNGAGLRNSLQKASAKQLMEWASMPYENPFYIQSQHTRVSNSIKWELERRGYEYYDGEWHKKKRPQHSKIWSFGGHPG